MRIIFFIATLLMSSTSFAQLRCVDKLIPVPRPSVAHYLLSTEWTGGQTDVITDGDAARAMNSFIFGKLLCRTTEIEFATAPTCAQIDATIPDSLVCYVNSNLGHFIISQDSGKNLHIVFHKVKRPRRQN